MPLILKGTALGVRSLCRARRCARARLRPARRPGGTRRRWPSILRNASATAASAGLSGDYVGYQFEMARPDLHGTTYTIDLHWRISNAQILRVAVQVTTSSSPRRSPSMHWTRTRDASSDVHALALALLHRAGNNLYVDGQPDFGDRLIWLYDFRVLVDAMTDDDLARFVWLTGDKGISRDRNRWPAPMRSLPPVAARRRTDRRTRKQPCRTYRARNIFVPADCGREWREILAIPTIAGRLALSRQPAGSGFGLHARALPGRAWARAADASRATMARGPRPANSHLQALMTPAPCHVSKNSPPWPPSPPPTARCSACARC